MKTRKPFSTISYNSYPFLYGCLEDLRRKKIITFWSCIKHFGEQDETKGKDHYHVFMIPSRSVQTDDLLDLFNEKDPHNEKPLKCLPFDSSDFANWVWYSIHDPTYLKNKGLKREYQYDLKDVRSSDQEYFDYLVSINPRPKSKTDMALAGVQNGLTDMEIMIGLNTPLEKYGMYRNALNILREHQREVLRDTYHKTDENGELIQFLDDLEQ